MSCRTPHTFRQPRRSRFSRPATVGGSIESREPSRRAAHGRYVYFSRQGFDMMRRTLLCLLCLECSLFSARPASAQAPYTLAADVPNVSLVFARLFGPNGLTVDSDTDINGNPATPGSLTHIAHFNSAFQSEFAQFSEGVARKL